jgi:hypothetical protein
MQLYQMDHMRLGCETASHLGIWGHTERFRVSITTSRPSVCELPLEELELDNTLMYTRFLFILVHCFLFYVATS